MEKLIFTDEYFMKEALKEARKASDRDEVPIGAVIVSNNRVIARGYNLTETLNDVTAHAEMQAITAAQNYLGAKYLNECVLYVTLEPCPMCAGAAYWARLGRIVFGAGDQKKGFTLISKSLLNKKTIVTSGLLEKESLDLLRDFFRKKR